MATQFENGLTMNQLAERNAELVTEVEKLRSERDASLNAERAWEKTMMEVCGEDGPASVASEIRALKALRDTAMQALKSQVEQLAAENVGLKCGLNQAVEDMEGYHDMEGLYSLDADGEQTDALIRLCDAQGVISDLLAICETPATDSIYAGIKADGVEMFAAEQRGVAERLQKRGVAVLSRSISFCLDSAGEAEEFAKQLRKGAKS